MKLEIKIDPKLTKLFNFDINSVIQKAVIQSSQLIQNKAKDIAPYLSGILKKSIEVDWSHIKQLYTVIGSRLDYSRRRHFENRKNPQTLRYLFRGYEENIGQIKTIFGNAMKQIFK